MGGRLFTKLKDRDERVKTNPCCYLQQVGFTPKY